MRVFTWLVRGFVFFALFAFSLNNLQPVTVHWFFGQSTQAPLVFVVLIALSAGAVFGAVAMLPSWWRQRRLVRRAVPATPAAENAAPGPEPETEPRMPPRDGL